MTSIEGSSEIFALETLGGRKMFRRSTSTHAGATDSCSFQHVKLVNEKRILVVDRST